MVDTHYRAFVSYSHRDREAGERLHRKLEGYRVPRKLVGKLTAEGSVPRRLTPIFRDREDLATSGDLSASVETALRRTRFLVVLCTPDAAASEWVNKEVLRFKQLHGEDRVLAAIPDWAQGAPPAADEPDALFPPALCFRLDDKGAITDQRAEPLAADLRETGDGPKFGFLKIVAGLIGVGLDDLVQRESARRQLQWQSFAASLGAIAAALAILTVIAVNGRNDATRMRAEAEDLIEFMLTDLSEEVWPVGRLEALDAVGEKALAYYAKQDQRKLDADALARRARALLLVGQIEKRRNDLGAALEAYEAAEATTKDLMRRAPNNPQWIFDHAQSVFYVASIALARNELDEAEKGFREYMRLAERLVELDPSNSVWQMELAYATNNLGTLAYERGDYDGAIPFVEKSAAAHRAIFNVDPGDIEAAMAYAEALSWNAFIESVRGNYEDTIALIERQLNAYQRGGLVDETDFTYVEAFTTAQRRIADAQLGRGNVVEAKKAIEKASAAVSRLLERDAENAEWHIFAAYIERTKSEIAGIENDEAAEREAADRAVAHAREASMRDQSSIDAKLALGVALARRVESGAAGARGAAASLADLVDEAKNEESVNFARLVGAGALALARRERAIGRERRAEEYAAVGVGAIEGMGQTLSAGVKTTLAALYLETDEFEKSRRLCDELQAIGVAHPRLIALSKEVQLALAQ